MKYAIFLICSFFLTGLSAQNDPVGYVRLCAWLTGSFSSEQQSVIDSDYYHIDLHMVPVFKDREDGYWLYVEQAMASAPDKPYRQRVYQVIEKGEVYESIVYEIENPSIFAGAWNNDSILSNLHHDMLSLREGCSIELRWNAAMGAYEGRTGVGTCISQLRGASYATSVVMLFPNRLMSWDRGFDADGNQVWGAEKGGYQFIKLQP